MNKESEQIFSSTGRLGVSRRPYERLYINGTKFADDVYEVERNFHRVIAIGERFPNKISRSIFRGVISDDVAAALCQSDIREAVEVALPLREFTNDNSYLVYLAQNQPERSRIVPEHGMIRETEHYRSRSAPLANIAKVIEQGFVFTDLMGEQDIPQVHALWGETFGWDFQEVVSLQKKLQTSPASSRDVWFSAIRNGDEVVSVAMAERLRSPGAKEDINLVESTEWRTREDYSGYGLMTANLSMLNAQILRDMRNEDQQPVIYAECNFQSRSDRAGYGAGFVIPVRIGENYQAPQILVQNVMVHDGQDIPDGKLRDFTFMYMPKHTLEQEYSDEKVLSMTDNIRRENV